MEAPWPGHGVFYFGAKKYPDLSLLKCAPCFQVYLQDTSSAVNFSPIDVPGTREPCEVRKRKALMLQVGSLNQQWRNPLASCGNFQFLYRSRVLQGMVQHFHRGAADQRRRKVRAIYEVPVSQASVGQAVYSPLPGCVGWDLETVGGNLSGSLCHQLILCPRKPLPMGLCVLPFRAWASGSFFTLSSVVRPICPPQLCRDQLLSSTRGLTGWLILSPW